MTIISAPPATRPVRRGRRALISVLLWLLVLPGAGWAVLRLGGWERGLAVQLFAFTPYAAAWTLLPALLALALRRWLTAAVAVGAVALFAVLVLPRAFADHDRGPTTGVALHVLTANMEFGGADPATIVGLVRDNDVSVLALQEFTPRAVSQLKAAGLGDLLPYSSLGDEPGASGSGLYSRYPITGAGVRRNGGGFNQAYGTIKPPGATAIAVESVHPLAPSDLSFLGGWRTDLAREPHTGPGGTPQILLGDFNSTLDHEPLRALISHGYRDAADADGKGLVGTWGAYGEPKLPPVTIDHVLVDKRIGVAHVSVHGLPNSDHRAVLANLWLPTGS
jgi:endonuclease/exonuclease/phosphatase family metal-dependent hydrolase